MQYLPGKYQVFRVQRHLQRLQNNSVSQSALNYVLRKTDESSSSLKLEKCFEQAKSIPGISKIHCIEPTHEGQLHCRLYSSQLSGLYEIDLHSTGDEDSPGATVISDTESVCPVSVENSSNSSGDDQRSDDGDNGSDVAEDDGDDTSLCAESEASSPAVTPLTGKKKSNIQIQLGLPHDIQVLLNDHCAELEVAPYSSLLAQLIVSGGIEFDGDPLINANDLKELDGKAPGDDGKWITNFIVDSYLQSRQQVLKRA